MFDHNRRITSLERSDERIRKDITYIHNDISSIQKFQEDARVGWTVFNKELNNLKDAFQQLNNEYTNLSEQHQRLLKHLQLEEVTYPQETVLREKPL